MPVHGRLSRGWAERQAAECPDNDVAIDGKVADRPVCELLGGTAGPVRAYASSMKRDIAPSDEAERFKRLRDRCGFDAFKFRAGAEAGRNRDEWPDRTEDIVPTVREEPGDSATPPLRWSMPTAASASRARSKSVDFLKTTA